MSTRILVVDDEARYIRLMEANLTSEGYEVLKATNGQVDLKHASGFESFPVCRLLSSPPREKNRIV